MFVLGLTGSIGMGKTTAAAAFRRFGIPVFEADATVHDLLNGEAVAAVETAFPGVTKDGKIDRKALGERVFNDPEQLRKLEKLLHPLVRQRQNAFLQRQMRAGANIAVLDVPLLFETGGNKRCDAVAVVSAPPAVQRRRVLSRPGMTEQRFKAVLAQQMSDAEKRRRADFIIPTGLGREIGLRRIRNIVKVISENPKRYPARRFRRARRNWFGL
jgi:dephospho-CoA kinase